MDNKRVNTIRKIGNWCMVDLYLCFDGVIMKICDINTMK